MKKIFKTLVIGLFMGMFVLSFSSKVSASAISISTNGPVLASVGMSDYRIVSQENNKIVISFNLFNQGEVQTGIKYGIKLVKEMDKNQFLADEKVFDESLTLPSGSNFKKEITYIAPSNLDGEYGIILTSRNEGGMVFGMSYVGKVKITSSVKGVVISPETCKLSIPGEKNKYARYNLLEGVDINTTESLQLNCKAVNTDSKDITVTPSFETHFRTVYGSIVPHTDVANAPIVFKAGEKKDVSILLPKALKPQAYDLKVSLNNGNEKSNVIVAHYVIQGISASVQNISLDKDFYEKGETAKMFFSWSQSADGFPGSRLGKASVMPEVYIDAKITNKYGMNCVDPIKQLLPVDHNTLKNNITAPIKRTCVDPKISISLVDKDGNVLDQKDFNVETSTKEKSSNNMNMIIALIVLVVVIVLAVFYIKYKKGKNPNDPTSPINIPVAMFILLFTVISVGINFPVLKTNAYLNTLMAVNGGGGDTGGGGGGVTVTTSASSGTTPVGLAATLSLDKSTYEPGARINVTTSLYYTGCTNVTRDLVATGYLSGSGYTSSTVELFNTRIFGKVGNVQVSSLYAPSTPGNYTLNVKIEGYEPVSYNAYITVRDEFYGQDYVESNLNVVSSPDFTAFKDALEQYVSFEYNGSITGNFFHSLEAADSINSVNLLLRNSINGMSADKIGGDLAFTREYTFFPVTVVAATPPTVEVQVNNSRTPGSITKSIGINNGVNVRWYPDNASFCTCSYYDEKGNKQGECGTSYGSNIQGFSGKDPNSGSSSIKVDKTTTFSVKCSN